MKKNVKKMVTVVLLSGLVIMLGQGHPNGIRPLKDIDPGPANSHVK